MFFIRPKSLKLEVFCFAEPDVECFPRFSNVRILEGFDGGLDYKVIVEFSESWITFDATTSGKKMFAKHCGSSKLSCLQKNGCLNRYFSQLNYSSYIEKLTRISCII